MIIRFAPGDRLPKRIFAALVLAVTLPIVGVMLLAAPTLALFGLARVRLTDGSEIRPLWSRRPTSNSDTYV